MATTLFNFDSVANLSPRFYLDEQVTLVATGLASTDYIEFEVLTLVTTETGAVVSAGACQPGAIANVNVSVTGSAYLTCATGATRFRVTALKPVIVIDSPQHSWLRAVYSGSSLGTFTVTATETTVENVDESLRGCAVDATIVVVSSYCPSIPLMDGGFGFHLVDPVDPAATVELATCSGLPNESVWIYPAPSVGNTTQVTDCDGNILGYGRNRSDCAPLPVSSCLTC
jgi:hypothetical protein